MAIKAVILCRSSRRRVLADRRPPAPIPDGFTVRMILDAISVVAPSERLEEFRSAFIRGSIDQNELAAGLRATVGNESINRAFLLAQYATKKQAHEADVRAKTLQGAQRMVAQAACCQDSCCAGCAPVKALLKEIEHHSRGCKTGRSCRQCRLHRVSRRLSLRTDRSTRLREGGIQKRLHRSEVHLEKKHIAQVFCPRRGTIDDSVTSSMPAAA